MEATWTGRGSWWGAKSAQLACVEATAEAGGRGGAGDVVGSRRCCFSTGRWGVWARFPGRFHVGTGPALP